MTDISVRPIGVMRGLPGTMQGPTVSVDGNVVTFNGTTGAIVKDSGVAVASLATAASVALKVNKAGDTMTGDLVGTGFTIDKAAGTIRTLALKTAGLFRFAMGADATAEGGANAGSNWFMNRYNDAGALIDQVLTLARATGVFAFLYRPTFNGFVPWDGANFLPVGRNAIINGDFSIWQRATVFNNPADNTYTADRWVVRYDGSIGTFVVQQGVFTNGQPPGRERQTYLGWTHTVAGSGSTFRQLRQRIRYVRTYAGQQITVSFYASADAARAMAVSILQEFGTGGSPSASVGTALGTANLNVGWSRFTFTGTVPSLAGKTLGNNGDDNLSLVLAMPINAAFAVAVHDIQVELGPVATEYERKSIDRELADCLPYYEKSFNYALSPAQNVGASTGHIDTGSMVGASASLRTYVPYRTRKRITAPTVTLYNPSASNAQARNASLGTDCSATAVSSPSDTGFTLAATTPASTVAGHAIQVHWTAEAEL